MTNPKTDNKPTLLDNIDMDELVGTTNLDIIDKYDIIDKDDTTTIRKVVIKSLPEPKFIKEIKGKPFNKYLLYMLISDSGKLYSLNVDAISTRRSIGSIAIKLCKAKTKEQVDLSIVIGKLVGIKREAFTTSYGEHKPLKFFLLSD